MNNSAFFHVGLNLTEAKKLGKQPIHIRPDGSTYFESWFPNHQHDDPDFVNRTYGDDNEPNMTFISSLDQDDWAWFIESVVATGSSRDWGYHIVYGFDVETHYCQKGGGSDWDGVPENQMRRIRKNAHYPAWKKDWVIILGRETSLDLFARPLRISIGEDPYPWLKQAMDKPVEKRPTGYWWKKKGLWGEKVTRAVLERIPR